MAALRPGVAATRLVRLLAGALLLLGLISAAPTLGAETLPPVPTLVQRVTDLTGTLSSSQTAAIETRLSEFERQRGTQMAVLVLGSTQPESIEAYAMRVAEAWKIGRRGVDDGLILILALGDRRLRIEVGYGLEGAVSDAVSRRIIDEVMVPRLRSGDTFGAIEAGIERLQQVVSGETLPPPAADGWSMSMEEGGLFTQILFGTLIVAGFLRSIVGRLAAGLLAALIGGGSAWYFSSSWTLAAVLAAILFVGITLGAGGGVTRGGRGGRWGGGGWGGPSGGGFSGGGGSFGGGGASGRW